MQRPWQIGKKVSRFRNVGLEENEKEISWVDTGQIT